MLALFADGQNRKFIAPFKAHGLIAALLPVAATVLILVGDKPSLVEAKNLDKEALLAFKANLESTEMLKNWVHNSSTPCGWTGVVCTHSIVTAVRLHRMQLKGMILHFLGNIHGLQSLNLSFNSFSGEIPITLYNLINLEYLHLSQNLFLRVFLQEVISFELPLLKTKVVIGANRREHENFKDLQAEFSQNFLEAQADIANLKVQLEESRIERPHKEECEAIRLIGAQPARAETQKVLDELTRELAVLEAENLAASWALELCKKQFSLRHACNLSIPESQPIVFVR
ncbi:hypothetical protein L7F22_047115 [Adiantum nelumboides]|nr:hypothetical protein [Adiantum nelumboides]